MRFCQILTWDEKGRGIVSKWGKVISIINCGVLTGKEESEDSSFVWESQNWQYLWKVDPDGNKVIAQLRALKGQG